MHTIKFTEEEMLALYSAISCKIIICEKYAETMKNCINSGVDYNGDIEKSLKEQEAEIKMYKDLFKKTLKR